MAIFNVQRAVTPKEGNPELWFMCSANRLMVLYIYVKFHETISDSVDMSTWYKWLYSTFKGQ